jgi:hypothetical protein
VRYIHQADGRSGSTAAVRLADGCFRSTSINAHRGQRVPGRDGPISDKLLPASLTNLDAGVLHDFGPMRSLRHDVRAEIAGRAANWFGRNFRECFANSRLGQCSVGCIVQAGDDEVGSAALYDKAEPVPDNELGISGLVNGRNLIQLWQPSWPGHGERAQLLPGWLRPPRPGCAPRTAW